MFQTVYLFISSRQLLCMQHMVFTVHLCLLAANMMQLIMLAASQCS